MRMVLIAMAGLATSACTFPAYEPQPTSVHQWERRQEDIQRREAERVRLCQMMNKDSKRYKRDCERPGDPT